MHVAFRSLVFAPPPHPAGQGWVETLQRAIDAPPLARVPVVDAIGVPYAYDLVLQDGAYLLLAVACVLAWLRGRGA